MTDTDLTALQRETLEQLPASRTELAEHFDVAKTSIEDRLDAVERKGLELDWERTHGNHVVWYIADPGPTDLEAQDPPEPTDTDGASDDDTEEPDAVPDLEDWQRAVVVALPATIEEIDEAAGDLAGHEALELLRGTGVTVEYDADTGQYYLGDDAADQIRTQAHVSPTQKTKQAKTALREERARLERLGSVEPLTIDDWEPDPDAETLVAAVGDVHYGDRYYDDRGRVQYDFDIADFCLDAWAESVIEVDRQWRPHHDECVVPILGDMATGTQVYEKQQLEVEGFLSEQIDRAAEGLVRAITTLAEHFEAVRVRAVVGNHGFQGPSAAHGSNTDLIVYRWLERALAHKGVDNVDVLYAEKTHYLNFTVRGWNVHMRHGQDTQRHIDETARSEADWRGWLDAHDYDIALRGHHHVPSQHWILNRYPAASVPSPVPGGEFADRIGEPDASVPVDRPAERKLGYCFGVSEDRRLTDDRILDAAGVDATVDT